MSAESFTLRLSLGSAVLLDLMDKRVDYLPETVYLMTPGRCVFNCKYCTEARNSISSPNMLSRVVWPPFPMDKIIDRIIEKKPKRVCIQVVNNVGSEKVVKRVVKEISNFIPTSVCVNTYSERFLSELFKLNVDRVGLPIDVVNPNLYKKLRGGNFFKKLNFILKMGEKYRGKITTHIIVGLGERDEELLSLYERFIKKGIKVGLFAFTPVKGTEMEGVKPPDIKRYRKIQIVTKLLERGLNLSNFEFYMGNLVKLPDFSMDEMKKLNPFNTRGCPNCNRPYYNERPKGEMYNYPYRIGDEEWEKEISLLKF